MNTHTFPLTPPLADNAEAAYDSLVAQTRAAVHAAGFSEVVLGLSGGIDSALVATIAVDALKGDVGECVHISNNRSAATGGGCEGAPPRFNSECAPTSTVHGVLMPSAHSSQGSVTDAIELAGRLGISTTTLPITPAYDALTATLAPTFADHPQHDVTEENLQARIRGVLLMALSNKFDWFVLATGNMSEAYTGYATLYGDMVGSFAPLAPLLKTWVYELAQHRNARATADGQTPPIPQAILEKEPSAELSPNQRDRDTLGSYDDLDAVLYQHLICGKTAEELYKAGFDRDYTNATLARIQASAFKREMACPGATLDSLKLTKEISRNDAASL